MSEKFDQLKIMQEMFPNATFVDANGERVADISKTIDHIADVSKKVSLTEQWKKGELKTGWYYVKNEFGNIFISEYSKDYDFIGERVISGFFTEVSEIIEIICEVPSYEEWQPFTDPYFRGLTTKDIAELAKKSIRLTTQHCKDNEEIEILREQLDLKNDMVDKLIRENESLKKWCEEFNALNVAEENQRLKELLKEWIHYYPIILYEHEDTLKTKDIVELYDKTREALK